MSDAERARVVAEARKWIGTPYHPGAGMLGVGADCGQLIVRIFVDCGLVPPFETGPYPQDFHLHRGEELYLGFVEKHLRRVAAPGLGDVMLFRVGRVFSHGGIVVGLAPVVSIVHAYMTVGEVAEDRMRSDHELMAPQRAPRFYSLWGGA